jgi:Subtilase family
MIRPRGEKQVQRLVNRSGCRHTRGAALCVAALIAVLPRLAGPAGWPLDFTSPAFARNGDHDSRGDSREDFDRQMRQQAEDDRRRQAEDQKRQADEQRRQAEDAASSARDQQQSNSARGDGGNSQQPQSSGRSGGEATSSNNRGNSGNDSDNRGRGGNQSTASKSDSDKSGSSKDGKNGKDGDKEDNHASNRDVPDDRPPATVEQWFKQLTSSKSSHEHDHEKTGDEKTGDAESGKSKNWTTETKSGEDKSGGQKGATKADNTQSDKSKPGEAKPGTTKTANNNPKSAKAAAGGTPPPITLPELATPDVLAVNASAQTIKNAKALGFKTRPSTKFANIKIDVTALIPPDGMGPIEAQALLNRTMPQSSFEYNKKYRIYRTASGTESPQSGTRAAALHAPGTASDCSGDHCFGRDIIGWKPEMRSCVNGVRVGIIDTSVDVTHPAFANKKLEVHHFGSDGAPAGPDWHGTGVTALLAGDAASGTPGMIPDANFFVADIFHADSDHEPASDTMSMLRAFDWLDAKGVKIVNMSLSGPADDLVHKAIEKLTAKGVLFVAAAGNLRTSYRRHGRDQRPAKLPLRQSRLLYRCRGAGCGHLDGAAGIERGLSLRHIFRDAIRHRVACCNLSKAGGQVPG